MKLGYFIGGSSVFLLGWLALTFISSPPPVSKPRSALPPTEEAMLPQSLPDDAGTSVKAGVFPISITH